MSTETARSLNPAKLAKQNDDGTEPEHDEGEDGLEEQLEAIESIQQELDSLNDRASEEILRVEQKYNSLRKPHFAQRTEEIAKVPDFWFTAVSFDCIPDQGGVGISRGAGSGETP